MPLYTFENDEGEEKDFFFPMKSAPKIGAVIVEDGVKWKRVYTVPQASTNTRRIDPNSPKDFNRRMDGKNVKIGDMWDESAALSAQRAAQNGGVDPVKQKYYEKYAKERNGQKHPQQIKEEHEKSVEKTNKKLEKLGIKIKINKK